MSEHDDEIYDIPSTTPDLQTELARQLQELVPEPRSAEVIGERAES